MIFQLKHLRKIRLAFFQSFSTAQGREGALREMQVNVAGRGKSTAGACKARRGTLATHSGYSPLTSYVARRQLALLVCLAFLGICVHDWLAV